MLKMRNKISVFFILFAFMVISFSVRAEDTPVELRIVKVRVAADQEFRARSGWQNVIKKRMAAVSDMFEENVGIQIQLVDTVSWNSLDFSEDQDPDCYSMDLNGNLKKSVSFDGADIVIGFSGKDPHSKTLGFGEWYGRSGVISDIGNNNGERDFLAVAMTAHEMCHIFGMFHILNTDSLMSPKHKVNFEKQTMNVGFDDLTLRQLRLMRNFDFIKGIDALDSATIGKATAIFAEGRIGDSGDIFPLAHAFLQNGIAYEENGRFEDAIKQYRRALALDQWQGQPIALSHLGEALLKTKNMDEAIESFRKAVALASTNADYRHSLADALSSLGKLEEALPEFREAVRLKPEDAYYHHSLADALTTLGKREEALPEHREAVKLDPKDLYYRQCLADALTALGKHEEALVERSEAVRLKPGNADCLLALGRTLVALKRIDEAIQQFQSAIKADAENINPYYQLGLAYSQLKKYPEAVAEFREMSRRAPQIPEPRLQAGVILLFYIQKPIEAEIELRELVKLKPTDSVAHFYLGTALYNITGKTDAAIAEFREAVRLDPNNANAKSYLDGALKARDAAASK